MKKNEKLQYTVLLFNLTDIGVRDINHLSKLLYSTCNGMKPWHSKPSRRYMRIVFIHNVIEIQQAGLMRPCNLGIEKTPGVTEMLEIELIFFPNRQRVWS